MTDSPLPRRPRDIRLDRLNLTGPDLAPLERLIERLNEGRRDRYTALVATLDEHQKEALHALLEQDAVQSYAAGLRRAARHLRAPLFEQQEQLRRLKNPAPNRRPVTPARPRKAHPHGGVVHLTGWLYRAGNAWRIGAVTFSGRKIPDDLAGTRVHVTATPYTTASGELRLVGHEVQPASQPNGTHFTVTGTLARVDPGEHTVRVRVYPRSDQRPHLITVHAAGQTIRGTNPEWFSVRISGQIIRGALLADTVTPVHAPRPARWDNWRNRRKASFTAQDPS